MKKGQPVLPEWAPEGGAEGFATSVMPGAPRPGSGRSAPRPPPGQTIPTHGRRRSVLDLEGCLAGVRSGDRALLARAITMIESQRPVDVTMARQVIRQLLPEAGQSIRVGITGVPGAGKSTFIEALGLHLCEKGHRVAVLAVDPSSIRSGGSILGDKTRMEQLSRHPAAFIRPSPSGGALGGVARTSRETMLLCEAAGYDIVLVETVGVGQSEVTVRGMVDFFLLLLIGGAGDELQGFKKGVVEMADLIAINKADGANRPRALAAQADFRRVIPYLRPATEGWTTPVEVCSALDGEGISAIWDTIGKFVRQARAGGVWDNRRRTQNVAWFQAIFEEGLRRVFIAQPDLAAELAALEREVEAGRRPAPEAVECLLAALERRLHQAGR